MTESFKIKWCRALSVPRPPDYTVIQGGVPYLRRWWVIPRNKWFNIYLHNFVKSDDPRALHDHPWWNCSIILKGDYIEVLEGGVARWRKPWRPWHPFRLVFRRPETPHRVELIGGWQVWTIFVTGPVIREWGFHCPNGWRHWKDFVKLIPNGNEIGPGCE